MEYLYETGWLKLYIYPCRRHYITCKPQRKAELKLRSMLAYCRINHVSLHVSKCESLSTVTRMTTSFLPLKMKGSKTSHFCHCLEAIFPKQVNRRMISNCICQNGMWLHKFFNFIRANKHQSLYSSRSLKHACHHHYCTTVRRLDRKLLNN